MGPSVSYNMLEIALVKTEELDWGKLPLGISERRRKQLETFKNPNARSLSLCAEEALLKALSKAAEKGGLDRELLSKPLPVEEDENGRPYFSKESPLSGICFNLSHSGKIAVAAVSDIPVGIDIEFIDKSCPKYAEKILESSEAEIYKNLKSDEERKAFFFENWVRKESYLKNIGIGLKVLPKNLVISGDGMVKSKDGKLPERYTKLLEAPEDYKMSICREAL